MTPTRAMSPYDAVFFRGQREASYAAARIILPMVRSWIPVNSVLDVGCGAGPWLAAARDLQIDDVYGVDGDYVDRTLLMIPPDQFHPWDLSRPLDLGRRFDLVISVEVAEHIQPVAADSFVDNLVRHGDAVLFSAAIPGQGGTDHINEQWPDYWKAKFSSHGYRQYDVLRSRIWNLAPIPSCYRQNSYIYVAQGNTALTGALETLQSGGTPTAWVHPELFAEALQRPVGLRRIVRDLPDAMSGFLRARIRRLLKKS